ncbi:MAG: hypothetical protein WCL28_13470 [bacterium]
MHMNTPKIFPLFLAALAFTATSGFCDPIQDPIADFLSMNVTDRIEYSGTPEVVRRVKIDVDGDGNAEVFIGVPYLYSGAKSDFNWTCYMPVEGGYQRITPADKDISIPSFDKIFAGNLVEVSKEGLAYASGVTVDNPRDANVSGVESLHFFTITNNALVEEDRGALNLSVQADKKIYDRYFGPDRKTRSVTSSNTFTIQQLQQMGYTIPNWEPPPP